MASDTGLHRRFEEIHERLKRYPSKDLYQAFGLEQNASPEDILKKFREKSKKYHPDRNKSPDAGAKSADVNDIYEILSDTAKRMQYDAWLGMAASKQQTTNSQRTRQPEESESRGRQQERDRNTGGQEHQRNTGFGSKDYRRAGSGVFIGNVELPSEFRGATIINNAAISYDGKLFAEVKRGQLYFTDMPRNRKVKLDNLTVEYRSDRNGTSHSVKITGKGVYLIHPAGGVIHVKSNGWFNYVNSSSNYTGGHTHRSRSTKTVWDEQVGFSNYSSLEAEINRMYEGVKKVMVETSMGSVDLGLSRDGKTYVQGKSIDSPQFDGRELFISELEGKLILPQDDDIELDVKVSMGDVKGEVAHAGRIKSSMGSLNLTLHSALKVQVNSSLGDVSVTGMVSEGQGLYTPQNRGAKGTLSLETSMGNIFMKYRGN